METLEEHTALLDYEYFSSLNDEVDVEFDHDQAYELAEDMKRMEEICKI